MRRLVAVLIALTAAFPALAAGADSLAVTPPATTAAYSYDTGANTSGSTSGAGVGTTVARTSTNALSTASARDPSALPGFAVAADSGNGIDESINTSVSAQRQARHVLDSPLYNGGGYFKDASDAQRVLDAYHSGDASILRTTGNGNVVVRYRGVTGYNNNPGAGYLNQPTDVFMIKGTKSVSVVPISPGG